MFAPRRLAHMLLPFARQGSSRNVTIIGTSTCPHSAHSSHAISPFHQIIARSFAHHAPFKKPPPSKLDTIIRNGRITYPQMRVVYDDVTTGKSAWKIMKRGEALAFAKSKSLDLVLGNSNTARRRLIMQLYGVYLNGWAHVFRCVL